MKTWQLLLLFAGILIASGAIAWISGGGYVGP
jgi:hypothetical protein